MLKATIRNLGTSGYIFSLDQQPRMQIFADKCSCTITLEKTIFVKFKQKNTLPCRLSTLWKPFFGISNRKQQA